MRRFYWMLFLVSVFTIGCSDDALPPNTGPNMQTDMGRPGANTGRRLTIICGAQMGDSTCDGRRADVFALTGQDLELRVAYDVDQRPLPQQSITFKLLTQRGVATPNNQVDGSSLRSQAVQTDASGVAVAQVVIGALETTFIVEASAVGATPVRWQVTVGNAGVGIFDVRVEYEMDGRYTFTDLTRADVFLFNRQRSPETCASVGRTPTMITNADVSLSVGDEMRPFDVNNNIGVVRGLPAEAQYTVVALVYGPTDAPVAFGCVDSQTVEGGMRKRVEVPVDDLPNTYKGKYNALHRFDLRMALETSDSEALRNLDKFLDVLYVIGGDSGMRAVALQSLLCDPAATLCNTFAGLGASILGGVIERILNDANPQLFSVLQGLSELVGMIEEFQVIGTIQFSRNRPDVDDWLRMNETNWEKLRLTWRGVERDFSIGDLTSVSVDPRAQERVINAIFDGKLVGTNLEIAPHNLQINMGIILLGLAEFWVLPQLVDLPPPVSLDEVFANLLPCGAINSYIGETDFCENDIAPAIALAIRSQISLFRLSADGISIEGTTVPVDENGDLAIDLLKSGVWEATINESETNRFFGCFNACKCEDATCRCQPEPCIVPTRRP